VITGLLCSQAPARSQPSTRAQPLLVSAAISLTEVLQVLAPAFSRAERVPLPQFNLAASGVLQRQIEQGHRWMCSFPPAADKWMPSSRLDCC
jgi:ABC-type molybdate transport system substrate-binding protein